MATCLQSQIQRPTDDLDLQQHQELISGPVPTCSSVRTVPVESHVVHDNDLNGPAVKALRRPSNLLSDTCSIRAQGKGGASASSGS